MTMTKDLNRPLRVLVIDDEANARDTIAMMLENGGYEVRQAADGNGGLRALQEGTVDLVITDLIMPEKEGIETIVEIRKRWPDIRIIAISGGGRVSNLDFLEIARKLGANAILRKPFTRSQLLECVKRALSTSVTDSRG
ncbi:MAG: response regulator [Alphaproteobacteria bacterium]